MIADDCIGMTGCLRRAAIAAAAASVMTVVMSPLPASAGGGTPGAGSIVHDPVSYVQHVRSVQSALVAEAQRMQQIQQQWQALLVHAGQYDTMVKQLARIRPEDLLTARAMSMQNLQQAAAYAGRLETLGSSLEALRAEALRTQQAHALSRLTWPEFVDRERQLSARRLDRQGEAFADARLMMRRVEADYAEVRSLQSRIADSEGSHQALQLLNQQMTLLIAQNAAVQSQLASRSAREAQDAAQSEAIGARALRVRELERLASEQRARLAIEAAGRARAGAAEAIEARRLGR